MENYKCTEEAYNDAVMKDIVIVTRDCNGKTSRYEIPTGYLAHLFVEAKTEEDPENDNEEILFVKHDDVAIYTAVKYDEPLLWSDLENYFCGD